MLGKFVITGSVGRKKNLISSSCYCRKSSSSSPLPSSTTNGLVHYNNKFNNLYNDLTLTHNNSDNCYDSASQQQQQQQGGNKMQKLLEKGKVNLSRSKSELGEQHKRMISHLSRGKTEISEQNKRILANLSHKGRRLISSTSTRPKSNSSWTTPANNDLRTELLSQSSPAPTRDIDRILFDLGINPNFSPSSPKKQSNPTGNDNRSPDDCEETSHLEKHLVAGYGEFDFIDGKDLIISSGDAHPREGDNNFADEVFEELSKSGTFKRNQHDMWSNAGDVSTIKVKKDRPSWSPDAETFYATTSRSALRRKKLMEEKRQRRLSSSSFSGDYGSSSSSTARPLSSSGHLRGSIAAFDQLGEVDGWDGNHR